MRELRLSAHSLDKAACPLRYWYYRVCGKAWAEPSPALVQGIAGHAGVAAWRRGLSVEAQEAAIDEVFAKYPPPPADDYRTPAYLKQVLAQYRAEYAAESWEWLEVERDFEVELGIVYTDDAVRVIWIGRRDAVGRDRNTGETYVFDDKFMSRDEGADRLAATNSCALKGYIWSYFAETGTRLTGAYLRRTVVRGPTKTKVLNFTLPPDPPIRFSQAQLDEWRTNVLIRARQIAERDPADPAQWPMCETLCRHTFGCCDYIEVCAMPPGEDRRRMLESLQFGPPHADEKPQG